MRRVNMTNKDKKWLEKLGKHIETIIKTKGYKSTYDFWINCAGDDISRATLNYITSGKSDSKITTLRLISKKLKIDLSELINI